MKIKDYQRLIRFISYGLGTVFIIVLTMPLIWVVTTSLRPIAEVTSTPPIIWPQNITFDAYFDLWHEAPFVSG